MIYAIGVRAIIDSNGLPEAVTFYRTFPREPGQTRDTDFPVDPIDSVAPITLLAVMDRMIAAAREGEDEALIVAHGEERGFLMPVATGGVSAMDDALQVIMDAEEPLDEAAAIAARPVAERVQAWTDFINELEPGTIVGTITEREAVTWFGRWKTGQAGRLRLQAPALENLVSRMKRVRSARFQRIEIRACNIGANQGAIDKLKEFFGTASLFAPNVGTFYVGVRPRVSVREAHEQAWIRRFEAPVRGGVYAGRTGPTPRNDTVYVPAAHGPLGFAIDEGFRILVWETSLRPHRYASQSFANDWTHVKAWVQLNIMPNSTYTRGNFILAGMWIFGQGGLPFAAPTDLTYRNCIVAAS
ncbi:MAG: hypothetical protein WD733_08575 [Bryobacterales bacterium]